jgi:hypothetical protein
MCREVQILHHLTGHPNVVQIIGVYEDTQYVHICMEVSWSRPWVAAVSHPALHPW